MIGQTISHYTILEKLGGGGMGVVYKAEDTKLKRTVALKFLPSELTRDEDAKKRFILEAQAASSLQHHNICNIHDIDETKDGQIFICMDCYEGETLKKKIERGQINTDEAIDIIVQVATGLQKAHEKGIIHRDIKPANIFITNDGVVKILDFGLAKLSGQTMMTKMGETVGTIAYMSPEQTRGEQVDQRTDIWSLGVVLYEMITEKLPFKGDYEQAIIYSILNERPKSIKDIKTDTPLQIDKIVQRMLEKDIGKRYQSFNEIISELRKVHPQKTSNKNNERKKSYILWIMGSIIITAIIVFIYFFIFQKPEADIIKSVAVLPFVDMSPQKDQEYFCDGMTEDLINRLSKLQQLRVPARTSVYVFKGRTQDIKDIGEQLKVQAVLEGSVQKSGDRLRITAQLINVSDGYHIWSENYDREMQDIFAVQDEISLTIVDKLKVMLLSEEKEKLAKHYTDNPEAYSLYLRGRYFWNRRYEGGIKKAIECFQQAINQDTLYALAYVGIADCYNQLALWGFLPPKEAYPKAKVACAQALEIDDSLAEAYASLGWIKMYFDLEWEEAEIAIKRAIQLNPNYATVHYYYALYLGGVGGRGIEALVEAKKSIELDPLSLVHNAILGFELYKNRQFDDAIDQLQKTLEMDPNFGVTYLFLGLSYMAIEKWEEAIVYLNRFKILWQDSPFPIGFLGYAYGMYGQKDKALKMLDELNECSRQKYVSSFYSALIYTGLGNKDQAFKYLDKAFDERDSWLTSLKVTPLFDVLRSDPRCGLLLKKMGLEK